MHYQSILESVAADVAPLVGGGRVADYIPALARVPIQQFGIALYAVDGQQAAAGDARTPFSIQSVSKVLGLTLGLQTLGSSLWDRIGREPSGNAFNSLLLTCGTYDAAGEFAFKVGVPCKSGVGGAIVAVVPGQMVLCAWSPGLDETGNSMAARRALELFVTRTGVSVF
ncbi:MAG: glutaminase [Betaproteobacteria bacterium]